jgi:hypothetical protein
LYVCAIEFQLSQSRLEHAVNLDARESTHLHARVLKPLPEHCQPPLQPGVRYGIDYDGVVMASTSASCRLAPAVSFFCCFYLALDDSDNRPLMIDQPEENLDPKSVFDELVNLFIEQSRTGR